MTSQYRAADLMRRRHAWLAVTIAVAVLSAEIAQPLLARRRPVEFANAAVERSLVYKRFDGIVLTLDLYRPTLKILPVGHGAIQFDALKDAEVFFDATLKKR